VWDIQNHKISGIPSIPLNRKREKINTIFGAPKKPRLVLMHSQQWLISGFLPSLGNALAAVLTFGFATINDVSSFSHWIWSSNSTTEMGIECLD